MADLTERQKQEYWQYNIKLTTVLLVIWFVVTYLISGLWAGLAQPITPSSGSRSATTWRPRARWRSSSSRSPSTPTS